MVLMKVKICAATHSSYVVLHVCFFKGERCDVIFQRTTFTFVLLRNWNVSLEFFLLHILVLRIFVLNFEFHVVIE